MLHDFLEILVTVTVQVKMFCESTAALVHSFVTSRVDCCNPVYAVSPQTITNRLQMVMIAAACVVSDTRKFDHGLKMILHDELHWLDVPERIEYKLSVMYRCLHGWALRYLADQLIPASNAAPRHHCLHCQLESSHYAPLLTLHVRLLGIPLCWPGSLELAARWTLNSFDSFKWFLKTILFSRY